MREEKITIVESIKVYCFKCGSKMVYKDCECCEPPREKLYVCSKCHAAMPNWNISEGDLISPKDNTLKPKGI